ncbi:hypothetical protein AB0F91_41555 [Amycolatopsis sp. NPDC023774]|uniref:hypothetical protein n=1 Tax=Amycolatopsis sp. NPDC023774 TaxID=3155015 RepID=UPI0033F81CD7
MPVGSAGQRYLDARRSIAPRLVAPLDHAIHHAANVCDDLAQGKDRATVVKNGALRFGVLP